MNLQRYAVILAHLDHFRAVDSFSVLRALQVDLGEWHEADSAFTSELALAAKRRDSARALQFTSVFHRTRRVLAATQPSLDTVASESARAEALRKHALSGAAAPPVSTPRVAAPLASAPSGTRAPVMAPAAASPSHVSPWSDTTPRPAPPPQERAGLRDETLEMMALVDDEPLPFEAAMARPASAPRPVGSDVAAEGQEMSGRTSFLPAMGDAPSGGHPFGKRSK
jgi:hypothetical protein